MSLPTPADFAKAIEQELRLAVRQEVNREIAQLLPSIIEHVRRQIEKE